jgi:hypothetical protein
MWPGNPCKVFITDCGRRRRVRPASHAEMDGSRLHRTWKSGPASNAIGENAGQFASARLMQNISFSQSMFFPA